MNIYHITYAPKTKTASLYFGGCNFRCRGCIRKKELQDIHLQRKTKKHDFLSLKEVIEKLESIDVRRAIFLGGEPSIDPELPDLTKALHDIGMHNILLTNGYLLPELEDVDEVQLSIKAYTNTIHKEFTGRLNKKVLKNFAYLCKCDVELRSESIFIPGYIDCEEIEKIAAFISCIDPEIRYRIDGYVPVPQAPWRGAMPEEVERAMKVARRYLHNVSCLKGNEALGYEVVRVV